jgi:hypothetical protein
MAPVQMAAPRGPEFVVSILLAMCCAAACLPWLARAAGPGPRVKDLDSASHAAMSAGMAAMLLVAL